uniref:IS66 family transposase n=1 Tax=Bacillus norwichensis TaxID=2762217 RepID=UPI0021E5B3BD|nr:transposase [Bacillus norwichensis]
MTEVGHTIVREEAKFIPAKMVKMQHIEHAYECKVCKQDVSLPAIQRSLADAKNVLAKVLHDKFILYVPLYRQVNEWMRYGLETNDKNLSNWVIRVAHDWLSPVYDRMKALMMDKSLLHVDETYWKVFRRSDGKSGQTNAYNWVYRTVPS